MELEYALDQFDRALTNVDRLEAVWAQMHALIPEAISFPGGEPDDLLYEDLNRAFIDLAAGLPSVGGARVSAFPMDLKEVAQGRIDCIDIGEISATLQHEQAVDAPTAAIAEYRHALLSARRNLVRERVNDLIVEVDSALLSLAARHQSNGTVIAGDAEWQSFKNCVIEIKRLLGDDLVRKGRWGDLARHMGFGQGADLHDILNHDWPSVRCDVEAALYSEREPLPVEVEDLHDLVNARPTGPVITALRWEALDDDGFERLIFNLLGSADGYERPQWLMKTRAPDRGRDISVDRVTHDQLSGPRRDRVIVQCRHWRSRSMNVDECASAASHVSLWEPPNVAVLIIATSGRFTSDAVQWIEGHNRDQRLPYIEMWAESHLELLLAARPGMVSGLGLRA